MVMRLNKICLGITEVSLSTVITLHSQLTICGGKWREREEEDGFLHYSNLVLGHGILQTNQKRLLFPSSEDYSTTGGKET